MYVTCEIPSNTVFEHPYYPRVSDFLITALLVNYNRALQLVQKGRRITQQLTRAL
jgi:hypothetical protein